MLRCTLHCRHLIANKENRKGSEAPLPLHTLGAFWENIVLRGSGMGVVDFTWVGGTGGCGVWKDAREVFWNGRFRCVGGRVGSLEEDFDGIYFLRKVLLAVFVGDQLVLWCGCYGAGSMIF